LLAEERRQAQTSVPDTRGVIREVIREIAGAAPPDDRDDDRETLRTLESAIAALREQVEYAQSGLVAERQRAEQAEHRLEGERQLVEDGRRWIDELQALLTQERHQIDTLRIDLADAVGAERIAAGEAAALRAIVTGLRDRRWWRRWFR
jgi:chromosome segregation ATPase